MASWIIRKPCRGEMARVNRGKYYHYGICISPDRLIHFATAGGDGFDDPSSAIVCETSLSDFARGSFVETLELTREERKFTFPADKTAKRAAGALGETGYDVLSNNCHHFANRCLYGNDNGPEVKLRNFWGTLKK